MCIDFIWISQSLMLESINSGSFTPQYFNTNHNALYISFLHTNLFRRNSEAYLHQHKIKKRIYDYDFMDDKKWEHFTLATEERYDKFDLSTMNIQNINDLNRYWMLIKNTIMNAAITTIDNHI
jgi:hypothetical protein